MTILEKKSDWIEPKKSRSWDAIPTTTDMHIAITPKVYDIKVCYTLYVDYRWPIRYDKKHSLHSPATLQLSRRGRNWSYSPV